VRFLAYLLIADYSAGGGVVPARFAFADCKECSYTANHVASEESAAPAVTRTRMQGRLATRQNSVSGTVFI